jgi:hypothetical protein
VYGKSLHNIILNTHGFNAGLHIGGMWKGDGLKRTISHHRFSVDAQLPGSGLIMQLTTDPRYQNFLQRATLAKVLGIQCRVAALADLFYSLC